MPPRSAMSPKKKGETVCKQDEEGQGPEQQGSDRETQLLREYDHLTDTLNNLKRAVEEVRRENELLQKEANQTRLENQEYVSYLSKRKQRHQSAIVTLSDQNQQELAALRRQREDTLAKYQEQADELRRLILKKERELSLLNTELAELGEVKNLQQQQLAQIAELEREVTSMERQHNRSLLTRKAHFLSEKERYESQAKDRLQALAMAARREAPRYLQSYIRQVSGENQRLRGELHQLIQRSSALRTRQVQLQDHRQQLLLEKEFVTELRRLHTPGHPNTQPEHQPHPKTQAKGQAHPNTQPEHQPHPKTQVKGQAHLKTQPEHQPHPKTQPEHQPHPNTQPEHQPHPKTQPEHQPHPKTQPEHQPHPKTQPEHQPHPKTQAKGHAHLKTQAKGQAHPKVKLGQQEHHKTQSKGQPHSRIEAEGETHPKTKLEGQLYPKTRARRQPQPKTHPVGNMQSQPKPQGDSTAIQR